MSGSYFSKIFESSPVTPLQEHMSKVVSCVNELRPFTKAVLDGDEKSVARHYKNIVDLEHEADALKKELRLRLPISLFMPVDRRDVLEVLTMQDMVAGSAKDVATIICTRNTVIPPTMRKDFKKLINRCVKACNQAYTALCELDELIETGFGKDERKYVGRLLLKLDLIEHEADDLERALRRSLFELENELHPVNIMFLYRTIEGAGKIADRAQRVGSRMQLMLAR
jgi:predicted phosphate transport protein (TIGR00153 family)